MATGSFTATGNGDLFVTIDMINYFSSAEVPEGDLPSDEKAVAAGRDWLRHASLLPAGHRQGHGRPAHAGFESAGGQLRAGGTRECAFRVSRALR